MNDSSSSSSSSFRQGGGNNRAGGKKKGGGGGGGGFRHPLLNTFELREPRFEYDSWTFSPNKGREPVDLLVTNQESGISAPNLRRCLLRARSVWNFSSGYAVLSTKNLAKGRGSANPDRLSQDYDYVSVIDPLTVVRMFGTREDRMGLVQAFFGRAADLANRWNREFSGAAKAGSRIHKEATYQMGSHVWSSGSPGSKHETGAFVVLSNWHFARYSNAYACDYTCDPEDFNVQLKFKSTSFATGRPTQDLRDVSKELQRPWYYDSWGFQAPVDVFKRLVLSSEFEEFVGACQRRVSDAASEQEVAEDDNDENINFDRETNELMASMGEDELEPPPRSSPSNAKRRKAARVPSGDEEEVGGGDSPPSRRKKRTPGKAAAVSSQFVALDASEYLELEASQRDDRSLSEDDNDEAADNPGASAGDGRDGGKEDEQGEEEEEETESDRDFIDDGEVEDERSPSSTPKPNPYLEEKIDDSAAFKKPARLLRSSRLTVNSGDRHMAQINKEIDRLRKRSSAEQRRGAADGDDDKDEPPQQDSGGDGRRTATTSPGVGDRRGASAQPNGPAGVAGNSSSSFPFSNRGRQQQQQQQQQAAGSQSLVAPRGDESPAPTSPSGGLESRGKKPSHHRQVVLAPRQSD